MKNKISIGLITLAIIMLIGTTIVNAAQTKDHAGTEVLFISSVSVSSPGGHATFCGLKGDINNDGQVNFGDINPMSYAMSHCWLQFYMKYPHGNYWNADINYDCKVNQRDVNPFVALLS